MPVFGDLKELTIGASTGAVVIPNTERVGTYFLSGTATLLASYSLTADVSNVNTIGAVNKIHIYYLANITLNGNTVTIFGKQLTAEQAISGQLKIEATYNPRTATWTPIILEGFDTDYEGLTVTDMNTAGDTITLTSNSKQVQYFRTATPPTPLNLTGNYSVTSSGTFRDGQTFFLKYAGFLTLGGSTLTFMGVNIDVSQAAAGDTTVIAWYDLANTTFRTQLIGVPVSGGGGSGGTFAILPVLQTGTLYPAANAGDWFRITCALEEGRLGTNLPVPPNPLLEPPAVRVVYNDDVLYCMTTTAGGDTAAAGAAFYVESAPRPFVPVDNVAGTSNYRINATGNYASPNTINGVGTNRGNVFLGLGNSSGTSSIFNFIIGVSHQLRTALYNLVVGTTNYLFPTSSNNIVGGRVASITGSNNVTGGNTNTVLGSNCLVVGDNNDVTGSGASATVNSLVGGVGADVTISNGMYIGGSSSGGGRVQTVLHSLGGLVTAVSHPSQEFMILQTNEFVDSGNALLLGSSNMAWTFEARILVAQTAVGAAHTNTSAVGDWAEYVVCGVVERNSVGTTTLTKTKWLDHRNRWIPSTSPNSLCYRNRDTTGARPDMNLVQPSISIVSNKLTISFVFPGFAQAMTDAGANMTPRYAEYLAVGDINGGAALTINGIAATDSEMPNTVTTTLAPCTVATFRNPIVDIFDGSDADGTGYYGGIGIGATATAVTKTTSVASLGYNTHGSYTIGVVATMTFDAGNATGVCVMSGVNNVHIGNNVVVVTGGTYTGANGNYAVVFTGGFGAGAAGTATIVANVITSVSITNGGTGYHSGDVITITCPAGGETIAATFTYTLYEEVTSVTLGGLNNNYTSATLLTTVFVGAGLAQAVATAQLTPQKIDGAGTITVDKGGVGYGVRFPNVAVLDAGGVLFEDGNGGSFRASGNILISQIKYA